MFFKWLSHGPLLSQLVVTRKCNLSCGYCSEYDQVSNPVPTEILKKRIDQLKKLGTLCLEFTGGEPMLHPDMAELIRYAKKDLKIFKVMLISNAYVFTEENVEALNLAGLDDLQVSIDGVLPNDITVKVLKPLRRKLEMLAKTAKFRVVMNSVMGSAPVSEVLEVVDFAKAQGFVSRVQLVHDENGQLSLKDEERASLNEIRSKVGSRFLEGGDYRLKLIQTGEAPFKCRAGSRYLYIDEDGIVRWCSQTRTDWGKPLENYTYADLKEQFFLKKSCNVKCTVGCVRNNSRFDEWRSQ